MRKWSFITNHGLILAAIARRRDITCREIGDSVGITERAAHRIISELDEAGYITKTKVGRRNAYEIYPDMPVGEEARDVVIGEILLILGWKPRIRRGKPELPKETKEQ